MPKTVNKTLISVLRAISIKNQSNKGIKKCNIRTKKFFFSVERMFHHCVDRNKNVFSFVLRKKD